MKYLFLFAFILSSLISFGQKPETTAQLKSWYDNKEYDKVISYKKGKTKKLEARAIFYMAMSHYMKKDDRNAVKYFDRAIDKGPADSEMYYFKSMTLYYMKKYSGALLSINNAIQLEPTNISLYYSKGNILASNNQADSAEVYFKKVVNSVEADNEVYEALALVQYDQKKYDEAVESFKSAILKLGDDPDKFKEYSYNIALIQQLGGKYADAEVSIKNHMSKFEDDYNMLTKLIQVLNAQKKYDEADALEPKIYTAHDSARLPSHMAEMFCIAQYKWKENKVMMFENFEVPQKAIFKKKHSVFIRNQEGKDLYKIYSLLDTNQFKLDSTKQFYLALINSDSILSYTDSMFNENVKFEQLEKLVNAALVQELKPNHIRTNAKEWLKAENAKRRGSIGTSFETAIKVASISDEYKWIRANYPDSKFMMQSLQFNEKKPYDVLQIKTKDGAEMEIYFDISSFFGKGF